MTAPDRDEHFRDVVSALCKGAALAGLTIEVSTASGRVVTGRSTCHSGDPYELVRVADTELTLDDVLDVKLFGPRGAAAGDDGDPS